MRICIALLASFLLTVLLADCYGYGYRPYGGYGGQSYQPIYTSGYGNAYAGPTYVAPPRANYVAPRPYVQPWMPQPYVVAPVSPQYYGGYVQQPYQVPMYQPQYQAVYPQQYAAPIYRPPPMMQPPMMMPHMGPPMMGPHFGGPHGGFMGGFHPHWR